MSAISHYNDTPMLYIAIFHGCKNDNFQMKNYHIFLFLLVGTHWNCLTEAIQTSTHILYFRVKIRKNMYTPINPSFTIQKLGVLGSTLQGHVILMKEFKNVSKDSGGSCGKVIKRARFQAVTRIKKE